MLQHIEIRCVRNLSTVDVVIAESATALFGANGSGKTSFLEAVHLLGLGRSFRTHHSKPVIQHAQDACRVVGRLNRGGHVFHMGIEKSRDGSARARVAGETVPSLSLLAQTLPLVLLDTEGLDLVSGPPEGRRRLIDSTLFHVEQPFLAAWRRYSQAVRQRNSGLRRGIIDTDLAWRQELAEAGERLTEARARLAEPYRQKLRELAALLSQDLQGIDLIFRPGWDRKYPLIEALERNIDSDRRQGFTQVGPHRADIRLLHNGVPVSEVLSRGQMKLLLIALKLVQGQIIEEQARVPPLYLVDDLPAELDRAHCASVCSQLGAGRQVILTAVDRGSLEAAWGNDPLKLFHVEHGQIAAC